jgi:hypothetical protein
MLARNWYAAGAATSSASDEDYAWHNLAQVWQTPGDGEALVDTMMGAPPDERAERMAAWGARRQPDPCCVCARGEAKFGHLSGVLRPTPASTSTLLQ